MKPRIAVVIPCYNYGRYLREAIESVLRAGRDDVEIVVVDDGSTDTDTRREIDRIAATGITVIRQKNSGVMAARNTGIGATSADYILPLDADNRVRAAYFEHGLAILDRNPRVGVVYGDAQKFGSRNDRWVVGPFDRTRLMRLNFIDACAMFRRVVWEQHGGYDVTMPVQGLEDWELWLGAMVRGWEFAYVPEILFDYRVAAESLSTQSLAKFPLVEAYIGHKYGTLYREQWMEMQRDLFSVKKTAAHFLRLVLRRVGNRFLPAGARQPETWREVIRPAR